MEQCFIRFNELLLADKIKESSVRVTSEAESCTEAVWSGTVDWCRFEVHNVGVL